MKYIWYCYKLSQNHIRECIVTLYMHRDVDVSIYMYICIFAQ